MTTSAAQECDVQLLGVGVRGCPGSPKQKAIQALHTGSQPGAGTLEAGLQRLRAPSNQQNPGVGPPDLFFGVPAYLEPRKVSLNPAWVCHSRLGSAGCPVLLLPLNTLDPPV